MADEAAASGQRHQAGLAEATRKLRLLPPPIAAGLEDTRRSLRKWRSDVTRQTTSYSLICGGFDVDREASTLTISLYFASQGAVSAMP